MTILQLVATSDISSKLYRYQAKVLGKEFQLSESSIVYISVLGGILLWKMVYSLTRVLSLYSIKTYPSLSKIQQIEWNNRLFSHLPEQKFSKNSRPGEFFFRGMSSAHAFFITGTALYLLCFSNLFSDSVPGDLMVFRRSSLSVCTLGVSVGYFAVDLALILWLYPAVGGMEYVIHHFLSVFAISHVLYSGEGQFYTLLVLLSESTTPGINLRWFLDIVGLKKSSAYVVNGVMVFLAWMGARILLFIFLFCHIYQHYDEVVEMRRLTCIIVIAVPSVLMIMNLVWFEKIFRGLKKTLAKRQ